MLTLGLKPLFSISANNWIYHYITLIIYNNNIESLSLPPPIPMVHSQCLNKVVDANNVRLTIAEVNLIARHNP